MDFEEWEKNVPEQIKKDALWSVRAYRLALFVAELGSFDATKLVSDRRSIGIADQLFRSIGSVSANIAEGYSRGTGRDRARFYEYALGSSREGRDWYYKGRHVLGEEVVQHRLAIMTEIIRLLLSTIPQQRGFTVSESSADYVPQDLLNNIPLP
jgi:four helix bundle protein